jgi:hypothetical protein
MAGNGSGAVCAGALPKKVFLAFSAQDATLPPRVAEQALALHPITTSSCSASGGSAQKFRIPSRFSRSPGLDRVIFPRAPVFRIAEASTLCVIHV